MDDEIPDVHEYINRLNAERGHGDDAPNENGDEAGEDSDSAGSPREYWDRWAPWAPPQ